MKDFIDELNKYKEDKEIKELIDEIYTLRILFNNNAFEEMYNHINSLMNKYKIETTLWNKSHPVQPISYYQLYVNTEEFLFRKGTELLIKKGLKK